MKTSQAAGLWRSCRGRVVQNLTRQVRMNHRHGDFVFEDLIFEKPGLNVVAWVEARTTDVAPVTTHKAARQLFPNESKHALCSN